MVFKESIMLSTGTRNENVIMIFGKKEMITIKDVLDDTVRDIMDAYSQGHVGFGTITTMPEKKKGDA